MGTCGECQWGHVVSASGDMWCECQWGHVVSASGDMRCAGVSALRCNTYTRIHQKRHLAGCTLIKGYSKYMELGY